MLGGAGAGGGLASLLGGVGGGGGIPGMLGGAGQGGGMDAMGGLSGALGALGSLGGSLGGMMSGLSGGADAGAGMGNMMGMASALLGGNNNLDIWSTVQTMLGTDLSNIKNALGSWDDFQADPVSHIKQVLNQTNALHELKKAGLEEKIDALLQDPIVKSGVQMILNKLAEVVPELRQGAVDVADMVNKTIAVLKGEQRMVTDSLDTLSAAMEEKIKKGLEEWKVYLKSAESLSQDDEDMRKMLAMMYLRKMAENMDIFPQNSNHTVSTEKRAGLDSMSCICI